MTDTPAQPAPEQPKKEQPAAVQLRNQVRAHVDALEQTADGSRGRLVRKMADDEVDRRAGILKDGLTKFNELDGERKKIKPKIIGFTQNNDGTESEVKQLAPADRKRRKELEEKLAKLNKVLTPCLGGGPKPEDFQKLKDTLPKLK